MTKPRRPRKRIKFLCPDCPGNPRLGRVLYVDPLHRPFSALYCEDCDTVFGRKSTIRIEKGKRYDPEPEPK